MRWKKKSIAKISSFIIISFIIFFLFIPLANAQQVGWQKSTWVFLPAVEGNNSGAVINTTITLSYPGTGQVTVTSNGQVQPSTLSSMEMAYMVAMLYSGLDYKNYNLKVYINTSGTISGPSGSFGVMIATYGLINGLNTSILHHYAITGAVSPSGLSEPIGGLSEKCSAANKNNLTLAFPIGNLGTNLNQTCKYYVAIPGIIAGTNEIYRSTPYSININIQNNSMFNAAMKEAAINFISGTNSLLSQINDSINKLSNQGFLLLSISQLINYSKNNLNLANSYLNITPYASASYAFTSYYDALTANYTIWLYELSNNGTIYPSQFIINQSQFIINQSNNLQNYLINYSNLSTLYSQELLATAFSRIADTIYNAKYTESIVQSTANASLIDIAQSLAYSEARLETAYSWYKAALATSSTPPFVTQQMIISTASSASQFTSIAINYANSLISYYVSQFISAGNIGEANALNAISSDLSYLLSDGNNLLSHGYYTAAIGVYEDALQNSLNIIFIVTGTNYTIVTNSYANELQNEFNLISSQLASRGLENSIDNAYMTYARQIINYDPADALNIMETAVVDSIIWYLGELTLNGGNVINYVPVSNNSLNIAFNLIYLIIGISIGVLVAITYIISTYKKSNYY
ncbi:MAG: hypothetical protein C0201_00015 [Caldisphaera sp.]|nr:MAG: hypothetical protein C0201_00015 [Caldisphaera sp.]